MFKSLYSKRYQNHRLKSGETVVLFYEITRKPAVLYQPQKKYLFVYVGSLSIEIKT